MAISTQRTLAQLKKEAEGLGLNVVQSGSRESKTDYVLALRDYYLSEKYSDGVPESLKWMMNIESPMLAIQSKNLPKEELDRIFKDKNYIAQEKCDGFRFVTFINFDQNSSFAGYSRNISVKDFLPVNYGRNLLLDGVDFTKFNHRVVLDGELMSTRPDISTELNGKGVVTETQLQAVVAVMGMNHEDSIQIQRNYDNPFIYKVFDVLEIDGENYMDKPYIERHKALVKLVPELKNTGFKVEIPPTTYKNKEAFTKAIIKAGGEGAILKDIRATYKASTNRDKYAWLKVKRGFFKVDEMDDTVDAWVTGFEMSDENKQNAGLVGSLDFSVNVEKDDGTTYVHEIGRISNIDLETRKRITVLDGNGNPTLDPNWYGRVAEIEGQCLSARALRLKHCVLVRWRDDKGIEDCVVNQSWLDNNVL